MKSDELLDMIGNTEDALLEKAESPVKASGIRWKRYAAVAAALVLCASGAAWYIHSLRPVYTPPTHGDDSDALTYPVEEGDTLPLLEVNFISGDMGFEGLELYDISELKSGNPWHADAEIATLPVFENYFVQQRDSTLAHPADEERMLSCLKDAAVIVGAEIDETAVIRHNTKYGTLTLDDIRDKFPSEEEALAYMEGGSIYMLEAAVKGYSLTADAWFNTRIEFAPSVRLPEGVDFGFHDDYEQYVTSAEYLMETYMGAFGLGQPTACIEGGGYNIYNEQSYDIYFYDAAGDLTEQILNYNLSSVRFSCDDVRQLWLIDQKQTDRTHKIGDYPILTPEEAEELFLAGDYLTTVPQEYIPEEMTAAKLELIYRTGNREQYYLPYYRIYAEVTPDFERETDIKTYGVFYIPAVRPEYLTDVETWGEHFN